MIHRFRNFWIPHQHLTDIVSRIWNSVEQMKWLNTTDSTKYIMIRVDMRTGDFNLLNSEGKIISDKNCQILFDIPFVGGKE